MFHKQFTQFLPKNLLFLALFALFCKVNLTAQVFHDQFFRQVAKEGMDLMYRQQHEAAEDKLETLLQNYSHHPAPYFLLATNRWWQSYISTTPHYHQYIDQNLTKALELNKKLAEKEELALEYTFFQYMCHAFKTRLHTLRREWLRAANSGLHALPLIKSCIKYGEESPEFYFSAGIYHYYAEAYPEEHSYLKPLMNLFPDGSADKGLTEMEKAASIPNFTQIESSYYLTDVYIYWKEDFNKAVENARKLYAQYPSNSWFFAEYVRALNYAGKYEEALALMEKVIGLFEKMEGHSSRHISSTESPLTAKLMTRLYHYRGKALLLGRNQPKEALSSFKQSLKQAELSGIPAYAYIPSDYLYMGYCKDRLGLREEAIAFYKKALAAEDNDLIKEKAKGCLGQKCWE
ncbi:MAG: hypothetical protein AAFY71_28410 [Bacteroidota bacterium]